MRGLIVLSICVILLASSINADGVYKNNVDFGTVIKGPIATKSFNSISFPTTPFYIQAIQVIIVNKTSNQPFDHDSISVAAVDFLLSGKKIISFTASNILSSLTFPSPNVLVVDGPVSISASFITTNTEAQDILIEYYLKYTSDSSNVVKLTRTATSVLSNFSSFEVPKGNGGFTISNNQVWQQNSQAMGFLAAVSPGIISLTFSESGGSVICQSTPTYNGKFLESMSLCPGTFNLLKGSTYTTTAIYDNSILRKGVFANWGFYVGFPRTTTTGPVTSTHSTSGPATSTHSTTGPATSHTSGPATSHSSGPATSHSSGPSSSHSSGPTTSPSSSSTSDSSQTSGSSQTDSSQSGGSSFTTTNGNSGAGTSGSHQDGDSTGSNPGGSTGYTVSSGSSGFLNWNPSNARKIEIY